MTFFVLVVNSLFLRLLIQARGINQSCCFINHTFILVISTDSDNSQANVCILIYSDLIESLSKDGFVVIYITDENPHICCI